MTDRLFVSRKGGGRGFARIEDMDDTLKRQPEDYIKIQFLERIREEVKQIDQRIRKLMTIQRPNIQEMTLTEYMSRKEETIIKVSVDASIFVVEDFIKKCKKDE